MTVTTTGGQPTGTSAGGVSPYTSLAPDETRSLSLRVDYQRTKSDMVDSLRTTTDVMSATVRELHSKARQDDLAVRALKKSKKSVVELLKELATNRGMGWSDIAEVLGVSISAIRKWRKGGDASPGSRSKLARIAALLDMLEEKMLIADPATWMEMDLPLEPGYFIRPLDLYVEGHVNGLIEIAEQRQTIPAVLDQVRPEWRKSRSDFEIFIDADGERSIRQRAQ